MLGGARGHALMVINNNNNIVTTTTTTNNNNICLLLLHTCYTNILHVLTRQNFLNVIHHLCKHFISAYYIYIYNSEKSLFSQQFNKKNILPYILYSKMYIFL